MFKESVEQVRSGSGGEGGGGGLLQHFSIGESLRILRLKISKIRTLFRTTPALNFITIFRTRDKLACEQQTHFRSSLLSLRKIAIFRRERSDDGKCVCCSQAKDKLHAVLFLGHLLVIAIEQIHVKVIAFVSLEFKQNSSSKSNRA